jgi:hypothetical protein
MMLGIVCLPRVQDLITLDGISHQGITVGPNRTVRVHLGGVDRPLGI